MKGLRAGGLALVVGIPAHTGKMVKLVELAIPRRGYRHPLNGTQEFMHSSVTESAWVVTGNVCPYMCAWESGWALFKPQNLQPIDDSDPDAVDEREKDLEGAL